MKQTAIVTPEFTLYAANLIEGAFIRRARKRHPCHGKQCAAEILPGHAYVEYIGETPVFQSGKRYAPHAPERS